VVPRESMASPEVNRIGSNLVEDGILLLMP